ncbi:hypothetical protein H4Q26_011149 [Puccinia striiformis f. sp. tritici PST-130]|nr:hypothetical protein H4Q26_011149 [Puccinia striiformis f. sp. tritici PST-130]
MPHSFGYRGRTRDMFKRGFKEAGQIKLSTFLKVYRVGDIVDIKANGAQQKAELVSFSTLPRAVGVIVYKVVGNRYLEKRVNLRIEHVKHSKCRDDFLRRDCARTTTTGLDYTHDTTGRLLHLTEKVQLKRLPAGPREAHTISTQSNAPVTLAPIAYDTTI